MRYYISLCYIYCIYIFYWRRRSARCFFTWTNTIVTSNEMVASCARLQRNSTPLNVIDTWKHFFILDEIFWKFNNTKVSFRSQHLITRATRQSWKGKRCAGNPQMIVSENLKKGSTREQICENLFQMYVRLSAAKRHSENWKRY